MMNTMIENGCSLAQTCRVLSKKLGIAERTLRGFYQRNRCIVKFTHLPVVVKSSKNEIIKIYLEGDSVEEIADLFGFTENQISSVITAYKKTKGEEACPV
jgi:hypothetical protein